MYNIIGIENTEECEKIIKYYFEKMKMNLNPNEFTIIYTDDINVTSLQYYDKYEINKMKSCPAAFLEKSSNKAYGRTLSPNTVRNYFIILLSKDCNEATIVHELTHIFDNKNFCKHFNNNNYTSLQDNELYFAFHYWSEFHARLTSIIAFWDLNDLNNLKKQIPKYLSRYNAIIKNDINNFQISLYDLFCYISRYTACEMLDYESFRDGKQFSSDLIYLFRPYMKDLIELYNLLFQMLSYEAASTKFEQLNILLDKICIIIYIDENGSRNIIV